MANKYDDIMVGLGVRPNDPERTSASTLQLDDLEKQLGYVLPDDYRGFLRDYRGCSIENFALFPVHGDGHIHERSIWIFFGGDPDLADIVSGYHSAVENPDRSPNIIEEYPGLKLVRSIEKDEEVSWPSELLPIGIDMGGNFTCLALSGLHPGAVFYWRNCSSGDGVYMVASSFDEFMHLLYKNVDDA